MRWHAGAISATMRPCSRPRSASAEASLSSTTLALSWSSIALAAPAVVKRNTEARSAPFAVAPLVEDLHAGLEVSADETPANGWRRVQLPSGKFGFVHDDDVEVELPRPAAPAAPVEPLTGDPPRARRSTSVTSRTSPRS